MNLLKKILSALLPRRRVDATGADVFMMLNMAWIGQAAFAATKVGAIDQLAGGPKTLPELVAKLEVNGHRLGQVLRALVTFGLLAQDHVGRYRLTSKGEPLADPQSLERHYVLLWGEQLYAAGGKMAEMVQSNDCAFELAHGRKLYAHYAANPSAGRRFVEFMNSITDWQRDKILDAFDFSRFNRVVDVGGGAASFLTGLLRRYPHLKGTLFDQPHMAQRVREQIDRAGLADRCDFAPGSFLENVPAGGDLYVIKHVIHDWPDDDVLMILRNISRAMSDDARLLIIEGVSGANPVAEPMLAMRDLEQMVWTEGRVRSRDEFNELLAAADLQAESLAHTAILDASLLLAKRSKPRPKVVAHAAAERQSVTAGAVPESR